MSPLAASNALIVRPVDAPACAAGDEVDVLAMDF
jgi:molybdopterin biosynthesis enzyme